MSGPEKIETILQNSASTKLLTRIARLNSEFEGVVSEAIPPGLKQDVSFSHIENGIITLLVKGPVIATKTRFLSPEILKKIQNNVPEQAIKGIALKIFTEN